MSGINNIGNEKDIKNTPKLDKLDQVKTTKKDTLKGTIDKDSKLSLKESLRIELKNGLLPNLKLLFAPETLEVYGELLDEYLEYEKREFYELIEKDITNMEFSDFDHYSYLNYLAGVLYHIDGVRKSDITTKLIDEFQPKLVEFGNEISLSKPYYDRLVYVLEHRELDDEQKRVLSESKKSFDRSGINLSDIDKETLKSINLELSKLTTKYSNNIISSKKEFIYHIESDEYIKDLPENTLNMAKNKAQSEGKSGYVFGADPTSMSDIIKYSSSSDIRRDFYDAQNKFASSGEYDNKPIILEILKLRGQKAKLLGYKNYGELSLDKKMAKTPETAISLIENISQKSKKKALKDIEEIKDHFNLDTINLWDIAYYTNKYKLEKFNLDEKVLKDYLEFDSVLDYLHRFIENFYGVKIKKTDIETYDPDVKLYEIYSGNKLISYFFLDPYHNDNKRPGAWANVLRDIGEGKTPVALNVCNLQKGEPTLMTIRDAETLFHEFGHAMHFMLSESKYHDLNGINVEWDFVEVPSQILENWVSNTNSLKNLAKHYISGEPLPDDIIKTLDDLQKFQSGLFVNRQNEFALLDLYLHTRSTPESIDDLHKQMLDIVNLVSVNDYSNDYSMYTSFGHIFAGGYRAGYFSYMWAEIIEADFFAKIKSEGMFDPNVGSEFRKKVIGQGSKKDAKDIFYDYMGREVSDEAFLERKGL